MGLLIQTKDKYGKVLKEENISSPWVNSPVDFNRTPVRHEEGERTGKRGGAREMDKDVYGKRGIGKDVSLGVNRVVPTNDAYWKGKPPNGKK